jgi:hypothetical protein
MIGTSRQLFSCSPRLSGKHDSRQKEAEVSLTSTRILAAQAGGMFDRRTSRRQDPFAARLDDDVLAAPAFGQERVAPPAFGQERVAPPPSASSRSFE